MQTVYFKVKQLLRPVQKASPKKHSRVFEKRSVKTESASETVIIIVAFSNIIAPTIQKIIEKYEENAVEKSDEDQKVDL